MERRGPPPADRGTPGARPAGPGRLRVPARDAAAGPAAPPGPGARRGGGRALAALLARRAARVPPLEPEAPLLPRARRWGAARSRPGDRRRVLLLSRGGLLVRGRLRPGSRAQAHPADLLSRHRHP